MLPLPAIRPISDLRTDLNGVCEDACESQQPIFMTKNGKATLVVMDADAFDEEMSVHQAVYDREARVFRAIMRGREDELAGRVRTLKDARADARALRETRHG